MRCLRFSPRRVTAGHLYVPVGLLAALAEEGRDWSPLETGGMLVGYRTSHDIGATLVITDTISGGPDAIRSRTHFVPDGVWQQHRLEALYEESGRRVTYLGDWHTHPDGRVRPSRTDRATYRRVAEDPDSRAAYPLILILALGLRSFRVGAYLLDGDRARRISVAPYAAPTITAASG